MNRRRFLQALFAAPVIAAPLLVPATAQGEGEYIFSAGDREEVATAVSHLPRTFAGRLEFITDLVESGLMDRPAAARLLRTTCPDLSWGV